MVEQDGQEQVEKDQVHGDKHEGVEEDGCETFGAKGLSHVIVPVVADGHREDRGETHAQIVEIRPQRQAFVRLRIHWLIVQESNLITEKFHPKQREYEHEHEKQDGESADGLESDRNLDQNCAERRPATG